MTQTQIAQLKRQAEYLKKVYSAYLASSDDLIRLGMSVNRKSFVDTPFTFKDADLGIISQQKMSAFQNRIYSIISSSTESEWMAAALVNDDMVNELLKSTNLNKNQLSRYYDRNIDALKAFQNRKLGDGMNLSKRVWQYTDQFKGEIEMALDIGLGEGKSASEISRDVRQYLQEPETLFRRVRDKYGNLQLSKHAQLFNPGAGVYRSSYKNAMRLTRTETNMSYHLSDHERWKQLDFVVGVQVTLSAEHPFPDICNDLQGKYPKEFVFCGWHPHCMCHAGPILATDEEMAKQQVSLLKGEDNNFTSENEVSDLPDDFTNWLDDNKDRIEKAKSLPYFIKDNQSLLK